MRGRKRIIRRKGKGEQEGNSRYDVSFCIQALRTLKIAPNLTATLSGKYVSVVPESTIHPLPSWRGKRNMRNERKEKHEE